MRKLINPTCLAALTVFAPLASADTIFGVYAGVGTWFSDYSGDTGVVSVDLDELGLDDEDNNFFYIAIEHPVPIVPNIKLQHTKIQSEEQGVLSQDFQLDDVVFTAAETVVTDLDLTHTDATLYYELADNWVNLDFGLTLRLFDGQAQVNSLTTPAISESVDLEGVAPMLYVKAQFDLPFTGFSVGADANIAAYSGNSLSDLSAKIAYSFDSVIDLGVELGYRRFALEVDDLDDLETDLSLDGPYAALTLHF